MFWLDIAEQGWLFEFIPEPLSFYRIHGSSIMSDSWKSTNFFKSREIVLIERGKDMNRIDLSRANYILSRYYYKYGDMIKSKKYALDSFKNNFLNYKAFGQYLMIYFNDN